MQDKIIRCDWAEHNLLLQEYHDNVWGKPVHDERTLFKMLMLEAMQAGLSWLTILRKMESLAAGFDDFDPALVREYGDEKVEALLQNDGIIKNKAKILACIHNAKMYYTLCEKHGSLNEFLWKYVDGKPVLNRWTDITEVPATTPLSDEISRELKRMGFKFVGSTTVYAFMQSIGMVNDHILQCAFRNGDT